MKTKNKMKNRPAQRDSKMSNGRLSGLFCRWQGGRLPETSPAQRDSKMSNLGMGLIGPMGPIGLMVQKPVMKTALAQRDSPANAGSNLKTSPYCPCSPYRPLVLKTSPAQRDSGISNLGIGVMGLMGKRDKTKNGCAQRGSPAIAGSNLAGELWE